MRASDGGAGTTAAPLRPELEAALGRRATPDGFVPFDRFMEVALYAPGLGYYARERSPFGPSGDFYTAPSVHPTFARTLAARVAEVDRALGRPRPFSVVDLGSGDGRLLAGIAKALAPGANDVRYVVVDRSPARRTAARAAVAAELGGAGGGVEEAASLGEAGPLAGVVVAHELLDALPARRLRWDGRVWKELGVRVVDRRAQLAESELTTVPPAPPLPALGTGDAGTVVELSPAAEAIVREVADHLTGGLFLVVDFGAEERELLAAHPRGTVAAVRSHRADLLPWEAPGESDLSTFVNFSRVRSAARTAGWVELGYRGQAEALAGWGFEGELARALADARSPEEEVKTRLAAKNLLFGFGGFRVLELAAPSSAAALRRLSDPSPASSS